MGDQSTTEGVSSSPLLSHVKERTILTDGEGRDTNTKEEERICALVEEGKERFNNLSIDNKDELNHDSACQNSVVVGDLNLIPNQDFGVKALGSRELVSSPQLMVAPDRLEEDEQVEDLDCKELEVNCIINYLCDSITEDILKNLLDEIVDTEEVDLQKSLLIKTITNFINPPKVTDTEALIVDLNDKENDDTFDALGIGQWVGEKATPDCVKHCKKRGRKSLSELRANDGVAEGQVKLTDMFHVGKGKVLPTTP